MSGKVVHFKKSHYDVYIGRPSKWGNPFTHIKNGKTLAKFIKPNREDAINAYRDWIMNGEGKYLINDIEELRGKVLGCWCHPKPCHGDVLLEILGNPKVGFNLNELF